MLGYISRLGDDGTEYVVTDVLRFMVRAWLAAVDEVVATDNGRLQLCYRPLATVLPYWLCLDEMNLAPVEQYFADYLSVLETRCWFNPVELAAHNARYGTTLIHYYQCDALLKPGVFAQLDDVKGTGKLRLRGALGLAADEHDLLWRYFLQSGIAIPFNLIVAGTVNMDETTHGFSRKVIDRALTFDFGSFFPHRFVDFFKPGWQLRPLTFSLLSQADISNLSTVVADPDGAASMAFLTAVNAVLHDSPFELAYRALNELLLLVVCFAPIDKAELAAVWDDFLMCKVLPRIDGDSDKLALFSDDPLDNLSLLDALAVCLEQQLADIWSGERLEWFMLAKGLTKPLTTQCRSRVKLLWMKNRLQHNGFTSFWP
jgi:hypothetical protein